MNRHFNNKAVSQVIAALLLIAIAVAAAILLYVFSIGLLGSLGSGGGQQTKEQLIMEAYNWDFGGNTISLTVRNVGPATIDVEHADFFVNGIKVTQICADDTLTPGGSTECPLNAVPGTTEGLVAGAAYPLKIVTPTGGVFSYSIIAGGSS